MCSRPNPSRNTHAKNDGHSLPMGRAICKRCTARTTIATIMIIGATNELDIHFVARIAVPIHVVIPFVGTVRINQ